jgi:hypothetical protein
LRPLPKAPPPLPLTLAMIGTTNEFNILISVFYFGFLWMQNALRASNLHCDNLEISQRIPCVASLTIRTTLPRFHFAAVFWRFNAKKLLFE